MLALRGSGQALYVGLADDCFVVASEPYGLVEETSNYLRLDGETPGNPDNPGASRGQIVLLDAGGAGTIEGIERISYDGTALPVHAAELVTPQITTRDIDRGEYPHYLLKEVSEAPASFRKTLRGKIAERDGVPVVELPHETLSDELRAQLRSGQLRRVLVIGQGTAAVAGQSLVAALQRALGPSYETIGGSAARHRAVRLPAGVQHGGHAGGRDQPERHHHGHQPHGGPGPGPGRQDRRYREPAQQRPGGPH